MWNPFSAIYVTCCASGGYDNAIITSCCVPWWKFRKLLSVPTTRHLPPMHTRCIHIRLAFAQLFSMVTEPGDQIPLTSSGSTNVIASWSVTPKTPTVSRLSHYWWFTTIQGEEVIEWHSPNMWKIKSENMACLALTDKAEMHRGHVC